MPQPLPQEPTGLLPLTSPLVQRGRTLALLWALGSLVVGLVLWGFAYLDTFGAGDAALSLNSDQPSPRVDHVQYTLFAFTYLYGETVLTGPHQSLAFILGWLLITTGVMWTVWRRTGAPAAQRVMRTGTLSLVVILVLGGLTLKGAERRHNALLQEAGQRQELLLVSTSASTSALELWRCDQADEMEGCTQQTQADFPNPALWGLVAIALTVGAALWRPLVPASNG